MNKKILHNQKGENKQSNSVIKGLRILDKIFNKNKLNYRILGSVLISALYGKPHRTLGDIDLFVNKTDYQKIISSLKKEGYSTEKKGKLGFSWVEAYRKRSLKFTFLLVGKFSTDFFSCNLSKNIELRISAKYLQPTRYSLHGYTFTGIPVRSIYEGLKISSLNPKRMLDRKVVLNYLMGKIPPGENLDKSFHVSFYGMEIPHAYRVFSNLYNVYGGLRVLFGKTYEIWD